MGNRVFSPGGTVYLRTDDSDYFEQIREVFSASPLFRPGATPEALAALLTDFERDFIARGIKTLRAAYQIRKQTEKSGTEKWEGEAGT